MTTQADWRMILGIQPQPNPWVQALSNLPGNLKQGMQIGDYFRERGRENQLQELMKGAVDPQTGEVDQGRMLQAIIQTYPEKAPALAAEIRKDSQFRQGQVDLREYMRMSEGGSGGEGGGAAGGGGYSLPPDITAGLALGAGGDPYQGITNIAQERAKLYLKQLELDNQLVPGLDESGRPVTRTRTQWQTPGGAPAVTGAAPGGAPAAGQLIGPERPPIAGAPSMDLDIEQIRNMPPADRAKLDSQLTPGQVSAINQALSEPGTVTAQTPFAPPQRNKVAPGVPGIPGGPAPGGTAPVSGIRTGLSEDEKQTFKIQEENRANKAKSDLMLQQDDLERKRQIEKDALEQKSAEAIAYSRKTAEERVNMSKDWREKSSAATKAMPLINEMENYIKEGALDDGSLAGIYGKVGGLMYALGAKDDGKLVMQNRMNRGFDSTANQLTFAKLGEKLGAQISDDDREFILTFSPKVGDQPEAAKRMIRILKDAFSRDINQYTGWIKAGKPNEFEYQLEWNKKLMDEFSKQSMPIPTPEEAAAELARRRGAR